MISRHWSGRSRYTRLRIMVLMATDLPEPVVPAISICGVRARSMMMEFAADVLAEAQRQLAPSIVVLHRQQFAQIDLLAMRVRQFDADGVAAGHHGDARRQRAHRARDIVGKADHARRFDAGRGLEFVQRHHRAGIGLDDLAADAEIAAARFPARANWLSSSDLLSGWRSEAFGAVSTDTDGSSNLEDLRAGGLRARPSCAARARVPLPPPPRLLSSRSSIGSRATSMAPRDRRDWAPGVRRRGALFAGALATSRR